MDLELIFGGRRIKNNSNTICRHLHKLWVLHVREISSWLLLPMGIRILRSTVRRRGRRIDLHQALLRIRGGCEVKPEIEELLLLLRKALHLVCEELRRTHRCNRHLEERQGDLATELEELTSRSARATRRGGAVKVNELLTEHIAVPRMPAPGPARMLLPAAQSGPSAMCAASAICMPSTTSAPVLPAPSAPALPAPSVASSARSSVASPAAPAASAAPEQRSSGDKGRLRGYSDRSSQMSSRRVTLKLSRNVLKKLSVNAGQAQGEDHYSDSGSEIFEANNPEEVLEMQKLLEQLSWKYEYMNEGETIVAHQEPTTVKPAGEELAHTFGS